MKKISFIFVISLLISCYACFSFFDGTTTDPSLVNVLPSDKPKKSSVSTGKEVEEIVEIDGKKYSYWQGWYVNGKRWYEHYWLVDGEQDGKQIQYADNGQKIEEYIMEKGYRHGVSTKWHRNGRLSEEANYKHAMLTGTYSSYYDNEQKHVMATYKNAVRIGEYKEWYKNGELSIQASFNENGEAVGKWMSYDEKGQLIQSMTFNNDNTLYEVKPSEGILFVDGYDANDFSYVQGVGSGWHGYDVLKVNSHGLAEYTFMTSGRRVWTQDDANGFEKGQIYIQMGWKKATFQLTDSEQQLLREALKQCDVYSLDDKYVNEDIHDGTQWKVNLKLNGKVKKIYCSNKFPQKLKILAGKVKKYIIEKHHFEIMAAKTQEKRVNDFDWLLEK